ncbi:hypothetical protein KP22_09630 [Pectobacterium betavasculorum]|uniref:Uncharacterized protein n=1 Tax=Pectobacterium betavasculorum TaxID=55207 RepID=A0A093RSI4_9GAMM|nr:hypothetical protein [Pectobacterium betavasculorum]KFX06102.1 hypothetical protein KP22_09630 [Pectobacterium betavasculorum]
MTKLTTAAQRALMGLTTFIASGEKDPTWVRNPAIYLQLADDIMGAEWANTQHFRFGASSLLASLLQRSATRSGPTGQLLITRTRRTIYW